MHSVTEKNENGATKSFRAKLNDLFCEELITPEIRRRIDRNNMRFLIVVAAVSTLLELYMLIRYGLFGNKASVWYVPRLCAYSVFFAASLLMFFFCLFSLRDKIKTRLTINAVGIIYGIIAIAWSIFISGIDYANGNQAFVFVTIILGFTAFSCVPPLLAFAIDTAAFGGFYVVMCVMGGMNDANTTNFSILYIMCLLASAVRYRSEIISQSARQKSEKMSGQFLKMSLYDELTKLKNRRYLSLDVESFIGKSLFLMMIDIDAFKSINDNFGHRTGDDVLQRFADILREQYSPEHVYRYGGEEFVVAVCGEDYDALIEKAHKCADAAAGIAGGSKSMKITFSGGISYGVIDGTEEFRNMLNEADKAMYRSKKSGKNRISETVKYGEGNK